MNLDSLNAFVEVALLGSFAAAARKLELDPSSVSRTIAGLEEALCLRLFQRSTRRLELTEAGEIYLNRIKPLLNEFAHALDEAHKVSTGESGTLRMTTSVSFAQVCILPLMAEFRKLYPLVKLELILSDAVVDLVAEGIDLACRLGPKTDSELIGTRLLEPRYHVCVSPDYFKSHPPITNPNDLQQHNCLVFTLPEYRSKWLFKDKDANLSQVSINSDLSISNAVSLRECARSGMGPVLLADWIIEDDIKTGKLVTILDDYQVAARNFDNAIWLLYPSRNFLPNKTRIMIDFLKSKFQDSIATLA
ncbi:Transcriptional regulator, LysR family [hydrothermal vent metagenome]|uniref:Transcriptional regulator, LysR family n=1 Tax=hydrothermal vent metagenome TaxID=652676 RepID=A0A3B0ZPQ0_9ZZZZ